MDDGTAVKQAGVEMTQAVLEAKELLIAAGHTAEAEALRDAVLKFNNLCLERIEPVLMMLAQASRRGVT